MRRFCVFLFALLAVTPVASGQEPSGPPLETSQAVLQAALHCPASFDDADHEPVLLVHGTYTTDNEEWNWSYVPALTALGFDVCTVSLPDKSLGDMQVQAEYVVYAVRTIAARTGELVDMAGGSQGALHPRWAVKWWPDVRASVDDIVTLAGPHHGTEATALGTTFGSCFASCWQMATGSNYLNALNAGDETPGDVSYTSIYTMFDQLVIPQVPESTSALEGASNILIQDLCPGRPVEHVGISTADAVGFALAVDAFTHPGGADPERFDIATCAQALAPGAEPLTLFGQPWEPGDPEWLTAEPPLKAYARSSAASSPDGTDNEPQAAPADDETPSDPAPANEQEVPVSVGAADATSLPASGANILGMIAVALLFVAAGSNLLQAKRRRSSRSAERRTLPASSRSGSDTNS